MTHRELEGRANYHKLAASPMRNGKFMVGMGADLETLLSFRKELPGESITLAYAKNGQRYLAVDGVRIQL